MRCKKWVALTLTVLLFLSVLTGCATRSVQEKDEPTEFMAWQFAQAAVKQRLTRPNMTMFPQYSVAKIERDGNVFTISAYVHTRDNDDNTIGFDFKVVTKYIGKDVFEEVSLELVPNK